VVDISRLYEVSNISVYQWLYRYGMKYQKGVCIVVEQSEQSKRLVLESRVAELERLLGQNQVELVYLKLLCVYPVRAFPAPGHSKIFCFSLAVSD
jgi:hypothetical protein